MKLIQQGAEAKIFLNEKDNLIVKDRIPKSYRIKEIDNKLIKQRTKAETKLLIKANQLINAPLPENSKEKDKIIMPYIKGEKLSNSLNNFPLGKQKEIISKIGEAVAKLHKADIIHGDLTTSNMILVYKKDADALINKKGLGNYNDNKSKLNDKKDVSTLTISKHISRHEVSANVPNRGWASNFAISSSEGKFEKSERGCEKGGNDFQIFFIDFGLGYISRKVEDKAVDVHLLKQALEAKHFEHWKTLFETFSKAYSKNYPEAKSIFERITAVERRGRYRH